MNDRALKVLEQYDLESLSSRRGRGSYLIETPQGLRIFSDFTGSENRAWLANRVAQQLQQNGYPKVDLILPNQEGKLVSQDWEGNKYVVKKWYNGRECDTGSENEILAAVSNLARIHRLMTLNGEEEPEQREESAPNAEEDTAFRAPDLHTLRQNFTAVLPQQELQAQNTELRKIRKFVQKRRQKDVFERMLLDHFDEYYEQAEEAQGLISEMAPALQKERERNPWQVTHGEYNHHHILMCGYEIATTNFENCKFDFQIHDLYRFMRKILEKHNWNIRLGLRMIDTYTAIRPISALERKMLYVRMLYPEKFRKLANHYYGSNKAWISRRFLDKLDILNQQEEHRKAFIERMEK